MIKIALFLMAYVIFNPLSARNCGELNSIFMANCSNQELIETAISSWPIDPEISICFISELESRLNLKKIKSVEDRNHLATCYLAYSGYYYRSLNLDSIRYYSYKALNTYERKDSTGRISAINNLAVYYFKKGDMNKYSYLLKSALYDYGMDVSSDANKSILHNIGYANEVLGDYSEAKRYYLASLELKNIDPSVNWITLNSLASLEIHGKRYDKAIEYLHLAIADVKKNCSQNCNKFLIDYYEVLSKIYSEIGNLDSLRYYLDKVDGFDQDSLYDNSSEVWGDYYWSKGDFSKTVDFYFKDLEISIRRFRFQNRENHPNLISRYKKAALANTRIGSFETSLSLCNEGLEIVSETLLNSQLSLPSLSSIKYPHHALPVLIAKAEALVAWYKRDKQLEHLRAAYDTYYLATQVIDRLRKGFRSAGSKLLLSEDAIPTYEAALETAWRLYGLTKEDRYLHDLLTLMEQNKASLILENLQARSAKSQLGVPDSVLEKERELKIDIEFYKKQLYEETEKIKGQDSSLITRWKSKIFEKEEALRQFQSELAQSYPEYHQLAYGSHRVTVDETRSQLLRKNDLLIEYFWGDSSVFVLGIDRQQVRFHQIPLDSLFLADIGRLRAALSNRNQVKEQANAPETWQELVNLSHSLYQRLLAPILVTTGEYQHLTIIPDGLLATIPFDLLLTEKPTDVGNFRDLPYLIRDLEIGYAYSARLLMDNSLQKAKPHELYAGFAPIYGESDLYAAGRSSFPLDSGLRAGFSPLLFNRQEVIDAASLLNGQSWLGEAATEAAFKRKASEFRILHLAMHAFTHDVAPDLSGLVFSPMEKMDSLPSTDEGILHAYEIYNLRLNADLAVLSACNTGIGLVQKGEGVMSLARAFTYAGCPSLLMSLWQADDEATGSLMKLTFAYLEQGMTKSQALRQAKLDYLAQTDRPHPHYWSTFVLIGDDTPLESGYPGRWVFAVGFVLLLLALARLGYQGLRKTIPED